MILQSDKSKYFRWNLIFIILKLFIMQPKYIFYQTVCQHREKTVAQCVVKMHYILIMSECLFHPNYSRDMVLYISERERAKVMDYAIIQKQVSLPKFVIFLTLAEINSTSTLPCHQNFFFPPAYLLLNFSTAVNAVLLHTQEMIIPEV